MLNALEPVPFQELGPFYSTAFVAASSASRPASTVTSSSSTSFQSSGLHHSIQQPHSPPVSSSIDFSLVQPASPYNTIPKNSSSPYNNTSSPYNSAVYIPDYGTPGTPPPSGTPLTSTSFAYPPHPQTPFQVKEDSGMYFGIFVERKVLKCIPNLLWKDYGIIQKGDGLSLH